jgi:alpha-1,6-mannosyltransferase
MTTSRPSGTQYTVASRKYQFQFITFLPVIILIFLGLMSMVLYCRLVALGDLRSRIPEFLFYYFVLFIIYLLSCMSVSRARERGSVRLILSFAVLFRFILFCSPPSLSDDIYRYAWEGYIQTRRWNPYRFSPDAAELRSLRNDIWEKVNNKDASAIYPPLTQMIHAGVFWIFRSIWGYKLVFLAVEGVLVWTLLKLLIMYLRPRENIVFYAWNPLIIVEVAGSGHHDVCVTAFLLGSALLCLTSQYVKSILLYASSILCKIYPILGLPFFIKRIPTRHFLWLPLVLSAAYLPYAWAGTDLFQALLYYRDKWRFNGFLFQQLSKQVSDEKVAERVLLLVVVLVLLWSVVRMQDLLDQLYWMTGAVLLCAPTLFPWYLVWLVPYLCFFPNPAWLLLTALIALSYYVLIDWWTLGIWKQDAAFLKLQYYPFYTLLIFDFLWKRTRSRKPDRKGGRCAGPRCPPLRSGFR